MERLETRELAYFVAVAEERHFGRAAARLGMAQPPLSRAIKQLEHRLGVPLMERTSRGVLLTAAGDVLLEDARRILAATTAAAARTRRAGEQEPRLVVVLKPGVDGGLLPDVLAAFAATPEAIPVDFRTCVFGEQADLLRSGEGDVAFLHGYEQDLSGLDTEELAREPQVLVVSREHPLAERSELRMAEIAADPDAALGGRESDRASGGVAAAHRAGALHEALAGVDPPADTARFVGDPGGRCPEDAGADRLARAPSLESAGDLRPDGPGRRGRRLLW